MYQEGQITVVKCSECGQSFPVFIFVADTDMVTAGCLAFTTLEKSIVLTEQRPGETLSATEDRLGPDVRYVFVRHEGGSPPSGVSFQEFREAPKPPTPVYKCIYCGGDAVGSNKLSKEEFLKNGVISVVLNS